MIYKLISQQIIIYRTKAVDHGVGGVTGVDCEAGMFTHRCGAHRIIQQIAQGGCQCDRIIRRDQQTIDAVIDNITGATMRGSDYRFAHRHRFHDHDPERLRFQ